jgi:hypothetical protein
MPTADEPDEAAHADETAHHAGVHAELEIYRRRAVQYGDEVHDDIWRLALARHLREEHGLEARDPVFVHRHLHPPG